MNKTCWYCGASSRMAELEEIEDDSRGIDVWACVDRDGCLDRIHASAATTDTTKD